MRAVCEVGPGVLRVVAAADSSEMVDIPTDVGDVVLESGDEPLALIDDGAVPVPEIWRWVFRSLLGGAQCPEALLVHPSSWPPGRAESVVEAARSIVDVVTAQPRAALRPPGSVWVEIAPRHVAVIAAADAPLSMVGRCTGVDSVLDHVIEALPTAATPVIIDTPAGVAGAGDLGALLAQRLRPERTVKIIDDIGALLPAQRDDPVLSDRPPPDPRPRIRLRRVLFAMGVAALAVIAMGLGGADLRTPARTEKPFAATELVEGRIAVRIPADWPVTRVTDGPGSARVQVRSPTDPVVALHITWSRGTEGGLAGTASTLADAMRSEPSGVFVEFNDDDRRSDRPAVTYREIRVGHDIRWPSSSTAVSVSGSGARVRSAR